MKKICLILILAASMLFCGCEKEENEPDIDDVDFSSVILDKEMKLKIYMPPGYEEGVFFPVLYFFPDGGGSVYTVMDGYGTAEKAEAMIEAGIIEPIIIVAVDIDRSFGVNSAETVETVETESGKVFERGMYEDYFVKEIIPYIDENYNTIDDKSARYAGGYSMGGFAALHIAMRNPEIFSKAGGHSPSLFIESFPDETVTEFLYPTDEIRQERDPLRIARDFDDKSLKIFIDVESGGSSGVKYLYDILKDRGMDAEFHVMSISHSRMSCYENMEAYLLFYAGKDQSQQEEAVR